MFKSRSESVSQNVARLNNSIEEYEARLEQEKIVDKEKAVLVPKIENLLDVYNILKTPEEKNELLKTVITQVTYLKTEKNPNPFSPEIILPFLITPYSLLL